VGEAKLPPWYVNVTRWLVYEVDLPRSVRMTGVQVLGLGWNHDYEYTDPVSLAQLCAWCGLSRARIYGHLRQLRLAGVLRYTALAGVLVFDLRPARAHGGPVRAGPSLKNETRRALDVVVDSSPVTEESLTLREEKQQQQVISSLEGGSVRGGAAASLKNETGANLKNETGESGNPDWDERLEVLAGMGVLEPARARLAVLGWATVEYLEAWEDWFLTQDEVKAGFIVRRVEAGDEAPKLSQERAARRWRQRRWQEIMRR